MPATITHIGRLSPDGVFVYDNEVGRFLFVNDPFSRIFEIEPDLLLDQPRMVLPFLRSEDSYYLQHRYEDLLKDKKVTNAEFRLHFADGKIKHLVMDAYLINNDQCVAGFIKNITNEKEHEDYIINYGARKDTLLDMITHNLSGPLNLSKNIIRWMQETYKDKMPGDIYSQLHLVSANTQECLDIVNDFLKEEHIESQRIFVKKTRFDVLERIQATLEKLIQTNKNKEIRLITKLSNLNISTDSVKFFQIIHNLISNSIKFTPDGGKIDIIVEETEASFIVRVKDDGIGIPTRLHPLLFDKNTPASRSGLNKEDSTGIGLHIVKSLVTMLGGKVWFESEEKKGSIFSVEFPKD